MPIIPNHIVEETWKRIGGYSAAEMAKESYKFTKEQPYLTTYVLANCDDLSQDAKGLAIYLAYNVYRMFKQVYKIPKIGDKIIDEIDEKNLDLLMNMEGKNIVKEVEEQKDDLFKQENVCLYVADAIMHNDDPDLNLTEEEKGQLLTILKNIIDCLEEAAIDKLESNELKLSVPNNPLKSHLEKGIANFADIYLNEELESLCKKVILKLSRKRNVPFLSGDLDVWASAIIWAIARVNFLHDPASKKHITLQTVCDFFRTNKSTVGQKATKVEKLLNIKIYDPEYTTAEMQSHNPFNELTMLNGFIVPRDPSLHTRLF